MFVDRVDIYCKAGDGGDGSASFRREAHVPRGGPNGGDGGKGGDVVVLADVNVNSLANIIGHKHWNADPGGRGASNLKSGRSGQDLLIMVPPGTLVLDSKRGHLLRDMKKSGDRVVVAKGGNGGRGNRHFATPTHQAPREFEKGGLGELRDISLELKLIADVGLVGKPNAGKSTLLSRLSKAHPEIADYPFTTKYPNLGLVRVGFDHQFVMADIPGLIEGAHAGVGLGHEFLRHVERTRVLVHLVEPSPMDQTDPIQNYRQIREEMRLYDPTLMERPEILVVTKSELPDAEPIAELLEEELGHPVMQISSATGNNLEKLVRMIINELQDLEVEA
ncbi:GTPase ObgE [uncultured Gimesia sp.]|uniref:GTPase ObgE n=1 Tax=uncultured Gimesia sp. TaxID=1678688 RepID=UPI0030DDA171|tara:strand:+ start:175101 stop:176102 length:1002 start_codon:yes stop_codon:yes gene_type:complete